MRSIPHAGAIAASVLVCVITSAHAQSGTSGYRISGNEFNPAISLILQGLYTYYQEGPGNFSLPGFQVGDETLPPQEGFSLGESELTISSDIDDWFYGSFTLAFASEGSEIMTEIEEAFIETLSLGHGFTLKGGRFYSDIGYLNQFHQHAWDFEDAPLVYDAIWGGQYLDDGIQARWVAPTDIFLQFSGEALRGASFPAAESSGAGVGAWDIRMNLGGDLGESHSWLGGVSYWQGNATNRSSPVAGGEVEFTGDSRVYGVDLVYKWAPRGNPVNRNFKLQTELFYRDESGDLELSSPPAATSTYSGDQYGWYAQAIYQFRPRWRVGARYGQVSADNSGSNQAVLERALLDDGDASRISAMVDYSHSEYSRFRLQYNHPDYGGSTDNILILQAIFSLGAHGAHQY